MAVSNFLINPNESKYPLQIREIFEKTQINGERIHLRALTKTDLDDTYLRFFQNEDHIQFMYQSKRVFTRESLQQEIETGTSTGNYHLYAVVHSQSNTVIGNIRVGIITHAHKLSDLAIFIGHPDYIGKGYAKEAIQLGNELCFEKYDFRKLHGGMFANNMASVKAYMKTGWVLEGILKAQYWVDGQAMDRYCVACFNPRYFTPEFLNEIQIKSTSYLSQIESREKK
jgi:ribosomal-protein-alanine N-acetyltransferase